MLNIILFGPPGSGKGTQANQLEKKYNLIQVSTGDLFRCHIKLATPLGKSAKAYMDKGELVPDTVTIGMLKEKVLNHPEAKGFIFDGFPRTIPQAEALDGLMSEINSEIAGLIALDVTEEEIVGRLLERGKTSGRSDDRDESVIRNRFQIYKNETSPVEGYYGDKGKSHLVDGIGSIEDIFDRLCATIDQLIPADV